MWPVLQSRGRARWKPARSEQGRRHDVRVLRLGQAAQPHVVEFCENGAKATLWDLTSERCGPDFFLDHTVAELATWSEYDLEMAGRLTHPLRYDASSDRYLETTWDEAFAEIGQGLRALDPRP